MGCLTEGAVEVVWSTNLFRVKHGLPKLRTSRALTEAAQGHAESMAWRDYFAHETPEGRTLRDRLDAAGYPDTYTGGNIAAGNDDAAATFRQWETSPGHRANLLGRHYTEIGVAFAEGGRFGVYWVMNLGGAQTEPARRCGRGWRPRPERPERERREERVPDDSPPRERRRSRAERIRRRVWRAIRRAWR